MRIFTAFSAIVAVSGLAASSQAASVASAIFAEAGPRSVVPGLAANSFTAFDRPYRSLNGDWWVITAIINTGSTATDEVVIVGTGTTGTVVAQEGVTLVNGTVIRSGSIDQRASVNNSGAYVFAGNVSTGPLATNIADAAIRGDQVASPSVAFRSFDAIPSLTDIGWGTSISSLNIDNAGRIGARSSLFRGINGQPNPATSVDSGLFRTSGATLDAREGDAATMPVGVSDLWQNFDSDDFTVDAAGNNWVAVGDTNAASNDDIVVYNNTVVIQEGVDSTGLGAPVGAGGVFEASILPDGRWWARGGNTDLNDWVILGTDEQNKTVIATTDQSITAGSSETWDDGPFIQTFFAFTADNDGNYVIGGTTNSSDVNANAVLVYNGLLELIREGDQIDLDGNGVLDDDAFISAFNNDDLFLADDLLYFTGDIVNAGGTSLGQAYLRLRVPAPSALVLLALGGVVGLRRRR